MSDSSPQPQAKPDDLRDIGLFGALSEAALTFLTQRLRVDHLEPGKFAFKEGEPGRDFFVLLEGEMEVLKRSQSGHDARVALLGPGDWFGEMSVVDVEPRSASVRATASSRLLCISAADLDALYRHDLKSYAIVVLNLARELSRRLRVADTLLADLVANIVGRRPSAS